MAFTSFRSAELTSPACLILRFALFERRMSICLWFALLRLMRPDPDSLNRLAAPRRVLIFGIQISYMAFRMIDMRLPSKGISFSTSAISSNSSRTRSITLRPRSILDNSRPRNIKVTFNFAPLLKNFLP